jgi:hypothetical protein
VFTRAKLAVEADNVEFHQFAEKMIRQYAEEGKNVIPLIKELQSYSKKRDQ